MSLTAPQTLVEQIAQTKSRKQVQNQSVIAQYGDRKGVIVAEFSVAAEMAKLGVAALPAGTYYFRIEDPNNPSALKNLQVPAGAILTSIPIVDVHEAKAGSGTITPAVGSITLAAVTSAAVSTDDGNDNSLVLGLKFATASTLSVVVASNTVTAGGFTIFLQYVLGTV